MPSTAWCIFFGVIAIGVLFWVGCVLAQSQAESEIDGICGYKLTMRTPSYTGLKKYHEYTLLFGSLEECQEYLNGYIWANVHSAVVWHEASKTRWKAGKCGLLLRVPPETKVEA